MHPSSGSVPLYTCPLSTCPPVHLYTCTPVHPYIRTPVHLYHWLPWWTHLISSALADPVPVPHIEARHAVHCFHNHFPLCDAILEP